MKCREARRAMHRRLDREASPDETQRLDAHVAACARCAIAARELTHVIATVRDATDAPRPATPRIDLPRGTANRLVAAAALVTIATIAALALRAPVDPPPPTTVRRASLEVATDRTNIAVRVESDEPDVHVFWIYQANRPRTNP